MFLKIVIFFSLRCGFVFPYIHKKPIALTVWPERCSANQRVLNDCNWCVCNRDHKFSCGARVCHEVDMFGHFNDAIREYIVGMEGHGSWRSNATACQPRMHYQREGMLCVCDDDGNWPNPACRDLFRVLHEVELTGHTRPSALHECTPRRLYLYGCDVCLCPPAGRIDPDRCTRHNCSDQDPIRLPTQQIKKQDDSYDLSEVYAECKLERKYIVGCRKCVCLKNNRLLCDENCDKDVVRQGTSDTDYCAKYEPRELFNIDCNSCTCNERGMMYCTAKRCLKNSPKPSMELSKSVDLTLRTVEPPIDALDCDLGTKYTKDCNTCFCTETSNKKKTLSCTLMECPGQGKRTALATLVNNCVENTVYEVNCLLCRCDVVDGVKRESCLMASVCGGEAAPREERSDDLDAMHGYCEPAHVYRKECNTCRCLPNGKVAACTAKRCVSPAAPGLAGSPRARPLLVDVVPVRQRGVAPCPRDHMYKVDCNFCFCLKNGNFLCTTAKCDEQ